MAGKFAPPADPARPGSTRRAPERGARRPPTAIVGLSLAVVVGFVVGAVPVAASAKSTTTTTTSARTTTTAPTTTTTAGGSTTTTPASRADRWLVEAIGAERKVGSVHIDGKITQGKTVILLSLLVNGDGEGGGVFEQQGNLIHIERVGTLLYFNAPKKFWASHATASQTKAYGGKWLEFSALDSRFASFDQFLSVADLVAAAFQGHSTPLTVSRPTTFGGHKVVIVKDTVNAHGKKSTGLMYVAATGRPYVYKIVDNTPGEVGTLIFSHYGKAVALTVPPEAINLS